MRDLDKALADIFAIRSQIAAGTAFRGYGPAAVAATGGLALLTAILQFLWLDDPTGHPMEFLRRLGGGGAGRRRHDLDRDAGALAPASFRPCRCHDPPGGRAVPSRRRRRRAAGGDAVEIRAGDAVDAARPVAAVGVSSACSLRSARCRARWRSRARGISSRALRPCCSPARAHALSPWTMGLPFVIGQLLMAAILHFASGEDDVED